MSDPSDPSNIPRVRGYRPSTMPCIGVPGRVYQKIRAASKRMGLPLSAVVYMACREEIKQAGDQSPPTTPLADLAKTTENT